MSVRLPQNSLFFVDYYLRMCLDWDDEILPVKEFCASGGICQKNKIAPLLEPWYTCVWFEITIAKS